MKPKSLAGMDLFDHDGTDILELQRDDELNEYVDDDAAWQDFIYGLECAQRESNHPVAVEMAISLLNNWRPYMASVMRGEEL